MFWRSENEIDQENIYLIEIRENQREFNLRKSAGTLKVGLSLVIFRFEGVVMKTIKGGLLQFFPLAWMSYVNECFGPLMHIFAVQKGNSIFRNDVMSMGPCSNNAGTWF